MRISQNLITYECHNLGYAQFFAFTSSGQILTYRKSCVGVSNNNKLVVLVKCDEDDRSQLWNYKPEVRNYVN